MTTRVRVADATCGRPKVRAKLVIPLIAAALVAGACGSSGGDHSAHSGDPGESESAPAAEGQVLGVAAAASEADREIAVEASDDLSFDPASVQVSEGEVVTFVIRNTGKLEHEFILGDAAYQAEHEEEMADAHHMDETANAITIAPGDTQELTWKFTEAGTLEFGCHVPGHYKGGMLGTIQVG